MARDRSFHRIRMHWNVRSGALRNPASRHLQGVGIAGELSRRFILIEIQVPRCVE